MMESSSLNKKGVEDLLSKRSLPGPAVNPGEAFIQIDSITIDLPSGNSKNDNTQKCEHFSIRKYVSDMRQKDNKVCWLFKSDGRCGSTELEAKYPFPPLDVPKFRWWQCQNCLQGLCVKESRKLAFDNLNGECNSDNPSCTHVALTGSETGKLVSEFKHILKLDNSAEKGEADADPLADQATATESHDLFCSNQKEERDYGSNGTVKVSENGLEDNAYPRLPRPTSSAAELKESHVQVQEVDDAGLQPIASNHEVTGAVNSLKNILLQRDQFHDHDQEMKAMSSSRTLSVPVDGVHHGHDTLTVWENGQPSDELNCSSSDDAEVCPGYTSRDKPGVLGRRKVRKVRLLTDLLDQRGNLHMNSISEEESPLIAISDATEEFGAKKVFQGRILKRKFHPEDECKMDAANKEANEAEIVVRDAKENWDASVGTVEDDAFAMMNPGSIMKNGWTSHGEDVSPGLVMKKRKKKKKKKKKKNEVETFQYEAVVVTGMENDVHSLMGPVDAPKCTSTKHIDDESLRIYTEENKKKNMITKESFQDKLGESRGQAKVDFSHASCNHNALMSREMGSSSSHVLHSDRNSCMCNKKSKMPWGYGDHVALPHSSNCMLQEDSVSGVKYGLVQSCPSTTRFLPDGDGTIKKGTGLSSYSGRTETKYDSLFNHVPTPTIRRQQIDPEEGQVQKKNVVSTHLELNVPSRSRRDEFFKEGVPINQISKEPINSMPFPNKKQHYASRLDDMVHFLMPQKEISGSTGKGEVTGSQVQSAVMKNHSKKVSKKVSAKGTCLDDIPMEIVELMAKIQYENTLHDTAKDQSHLDTRKSPSYQNLRLSSEYENGDLKLLQDEGSTGEQVLAKHVKKLHNAKSKAVDINYSPQVNMDYEIMTQVQQNQNQDPFKGHGVLLSQYHENPNVSKRNKDIMGNNYKKSSGAFVGVSACNTCKIAETSKEPFHLWSSSMVPITHIPAHRNVAPNFLLQSPDLKAPRSEDKSKSEEPNKGFIMENSGGENTYTLRLKEMKLQSPVGSSDFYSNDKISALHLLSLMDAHSGQNVNRNPRVAKRSSLIPHWSSSKEIDFSADRASEKMRLPSSDYSTINSLASGKHNCSSSTAPTLGSSSWLDFRENIRNGVMSQVPLKVPEKAQKKCSDLVGLTGSNLQKYAATVCTPAHNQQKNEIHGVSNSVIIPPKYRTEEKSEKEHLRSTTGSVWPLGYRLQMGTCTINRNPAEFSIPDAGNVYTIGGSELRFGKRVRAPDRPTTMIRDLNKPKRGRKKKTATKNDQQVENHHHHQRIL